MPLINWHSCQLEDPEKYDGFAQKACAEKHDGKCITHNYGLYDDEDKASELQALRYKKTTWTEASAKSHCKTRDGTFEPASDEEDKSMSEDFIRQKFEKLINQLNLSSDFEDWEYLIHHIHKDPDTGKEEIHHCLLVDHLGNLFEIDHVEDSKGKFRHCITGLKEDQEVYWSDEEAEADGQEIPCANRQLD